MYEKHYNVTFSRDVHSSWAILTALYHFTRKGHFYDDLTSPATIKLAYSFECKTISRFSTGTINASSFSFYENPSVKV